MKRVIEGKTYNTDTATIVASYEYTDEKENEVTVGLYQTRGGAFFGVHSWVEEDSEGDPRRRFEFEPFSRRDIDRLISGQFAVGGIEIIDERALTLPPEAEAEEEPSTTIYFRLPSSLKGRVEVLAKEAGLSVNAWMLRCVERCAAPQPAE